MSMAVTHRPARAELTGDLDLVSGDKLEALMIPMLTPGARVTIGLRDVLFADSSGLGALLAIAQRAAENGAELVLDDPSAPVRRVLDITGIADQFQITSSSGLSPRHLAP
jgi:anti-anti-sigma factor